MVDEIGIERERSFEFGDGGVVLTLVKQDLSKMSASLWQAGVEAHGRLREFKGAIERSWTEIVAVERFDIGVDVCPGQHRSGARVIRGDRKRLFEHAPRVIKRRFRASVGMQEKGFHAAQ